MYEILQYIIYTLTHSASLNAIVPATQVFTGPVDIATELQSELLLPQINVHVISESSRTVPANTRDTMVQIDIWSRNSFLETVQVSELIIGLLNYQAPSQGVAKIFWERLGGTVDQYESDRRIFHRSLTYVIWSIQGQ